MKRYVRNGAGCVPRAGMRSNAMTSSSPHVSFVVPCYQLAHYLPECVGSNVADVPGFEIILLDDRSPDATGRRRWIMAAHPIGGISYVRNPENLGNIRNYNKGIGLASGKYIWVLSPDDRLRSPRIVERYMRVMESRADIGFAFCPAHVIRDSEDRALRTVPLCLDDAILEDRSS